MDHAAIYSIGAVARTLGVSASTLRTWEERYGVIRPHRTEGGHRLYTTVQVEQLRFVTSRVKEGLSAADAHRLLSERLYGGNGPRREADGDTPLVLLVEQDRFTAHYAEHFLGEEGYEVVLADHVEHARRLFDLRSPVLAVVDLLVSGGEGMAFCRSLREDRPGVAILAVSTLGWEEAALSSGADAFLRKPLDRRGLVSTVRGLLGHTSSRETTRAS